MAVVLLEDSAGSAVSVDEGESCIITATLYDATGEVLAKAAISTLTVSLINEADGSIINSREDQDILDANGGTVSTPGVVTLKLQPADNVMVDTSGSEKEVHVVAFEWTWTDGQSVSMTGRQEYGMTVSAATNVDATPSGSEPGWPS